MLLLCPGQGRWTTYDAFGLAHTYEGGWVDGREEGEGVVQWTDPDLGPVVARGPFSDGLQHGDGCTWTLASGHVFFKGRMDRGKFAQGQWNSGETTMRGGVLPPLSLLFLLSCFTPAQVA